MGIFNQQEGKKSRKMKIIITLQFRSDNGDIWEKIMICSLRGLFQWLIQYFLTIIRRQLFTMPFIPGKIIKWKIKRIQWK